jgi:apolipoprotein N-acyltransferase
MVAAGTATAALSYFATGLHPVWPLLWLAPIPILAVASPLSRSGAFGLATVAWFIGQTNLWKHLAYGLALPRLLVVVSFLIPAAVFGLGVLLVRSFLLRGSLFSAAFAFPLYWVACEFLSASVSPHSTYGNLAYTQMNCLPVIQIAALTGIWGISFVVFLFAGTVGTLLSGAGTPTQRRVLCITVCGLLCAVFLFGLARLRSSSATQAVAVLLMAKDVPMSVYLGPEQETLQLLHEYAEKIRRTAPPGTDVVVLPEKIGRVSENNLPQLDALFSSVAREVGSTIVLGLVRKGPTEAFNSARVYSTDGKLEANYDKHHLLLGVEPEKPGSKRVLLRQMSGDWGVQICKDMDFPQLSREYGRDGANLLLVPAWDFDRDRWLHARMAVLRGVENGFALARAARNGLLTLSDNRGRIPEEKPTIPGQFVSLRGTVNVARERTFYNQTGNWFGWLCVIALFSLLIWWLVNGKANFAAQPSPGESQISRL